MRPVLYDGLGLLPPRAYASADMPINGVASKLVHVVWSKSRSPVNATCWTPDGRRCIVGSGNGEFSLWTSSNFAFESAMQIHEGETTLSSHCQRLIIFYTWTILSP